MRNIFIQIIPPPPTSISDVFEKTKLFRIRLVDSLVFGNTRISNMENYCIANTVVSYRVMSFKTRQLN